MSESILPFNKAVEWHLLQRLSKRLRPVKPVDLYDELADDLRLNQRQRLLKRRTTNESLWHNRVQTARKHLVEAGFMNRKPSGQWSLTQAGKNEAERKALAIFGLDLDELERIFS